MISKQKAQAMLTREVREHHTAFIKTPLIISALMIVVMLGSVLLVNRLSIVGNTAMEVIMQEHSSDAWVSVTVDGGESQELVVSEEWETEESETLPEEWKFSEKWTFQPPGTSGSADSELENFVDRGSLDPLLEGIFVFFLVIMNIVIIVYLLGAMYQDRKDRSVLFWKSMPVSEWQDVLIKMGVAAVLIPFVTVVVAIVTQLAYVLLAMLLVYRLDMSPVDTIWANVNLLDLALRQFTPLVGSAIWFAPFYAWLLLASAAAKRSPFMLAIAPVVAVVMFEKFFIGTEYVGQLIANHVPSVMVNDDVGLYSYGPNWSFSAILEMVGSVAVAGGLLAAVVWLRKSRFEL
ncbi:MAG: ABC-2 type transport system permease protein [Halieaceae bacterium]|jgi:ABC-2 type transport system permease protein